ncbi:hypothetical protein VM1G_10637 [Cytospora mali]|uniref:Aquaporin-like protein n=1 Tax=Cytospora mali TaxID=578113 RepID=A0A194VIC0_CYTMA|nr:hypothetical protein VM1G_10637 [Valsa mali]
MADEQPHQSVEKMDTIPESRPASPIQPEPTHQPQRRVGGLGLPAALKRTSTQPTINESDTEQQNGGPATRHRRGLSGSNSLRPVDSNRSRARAGSTSSSRYRRSANLDRQPTFIAQGMRKRTTTWNLNGPNALGGGPVRRRTIFLGNGASSAVDAGGDGGSQAGFTLAGPGNPLDTIVANQPYVDPGYLDLNPAYEQAPNSRPVWGLAKPLPHVVRPGMIPTRTEILEQTPGQMQHEQQATEEFDLEAGRVESTMNPHKISSALQAAQQDREFRLIRTYTGQSNIGGGARRKASVSSGQGRQSVSENTGKPDKAEPEQATQRARRQSVTIKELSSVAEQPTPDENNTSNDVEYFPELEQEKLDDDWIEDPGQLNPFDPELDEIHNLHTHWSVIRLKFREPLAELLAVVCQLTLGFCTDLVVTCSNGQAGNGISADWAWGLASMLGIYIAGGISGAHLNPAMSIMLWIYRGFPLRKMPLYAIAQVLGAFIAALISFGLFRNSIIEYSNTADWAATGSASAFITYPRNTWIDPVTAFFSEFTGTAILAIAVLALGDDSNAPPGAGMNAFIVGLIITVLSMALGWNTGLAMNPARDIGPRLALLALGYGTENTFKGSYWFWGPWCGPILGALFGAFLYDGAIFVGGESPVNYPRRRIKRALHKKKNKWNKRFQTVTRIGRPKYASDEWKFEVEQAR